MLSNLALDDWEQYIERLEQYFVANELVKTKKKVVSLPYCDGG